MPSKHHPKYQRSIRVRGVRHPQPDLRLAARALLEMSKTMTPEQATALDAQSKAKTYKAIIKDVARKRSR